ncbi:MAG: NADH dehydrogenase subunit [Spirochaetaceae bacterium]|nr:MAG: NADH dehydrogenase subunit [Spirochaetaceae bacterium]
MFGAFLIAALRKRPLTRDIVATLLVASSLGVLISLYPLLGSGALHSSYPIPTIGLALNFRVDGAGFVFAVLIGFVWLLATVFCRAYMAHAHAQTRFYSLLVFTLGGCIGVVTAGDFLTLFVFFELMTFSSYVLVVHEQDPESMKAGDLFIRLGVAGGLVLLFAIILMQYHLGHTDIRPLLPEIAASGMNQFLVIALFVIGFGVKAGMVPLHIWLPRAHPVAPAPASALLSGIMIKVGAYGILRVLIEVFSAPGPVDSGSEHVFFSTAASSSGYVLIWMGVLTMFFGAFLALQQTMAKKTLAYSSVSQMGYILLAIGSAAFLGTDGAMGFVGALYHIINHAFFKAGLFIMVGAIYIHTHELDIDRVRGMARVFPLLTVTFVVAAAGIAGVPGFNGYASKTLVHHAIEKAYHYSHLPSLFWAEKIFVLTSALTICYFIKLFRGLFLGPTSAAFANKGYKQHISARIIPVVFAAIVLLIGLFPQVLYQGLVTPAMAGFAFDPYNIGTYITGLEFFVWPDIRAMLIVFALTAVIYPVGNYIGLFELLRHGRLAQVKKVSTVRLPELPAWLSVEALVYQPLAHAGFRICTYMHTYLDAGVNYTLFTGIASLFHRLIRSVGSLEKLLLGLYEGGSDIPGKLSGASEDRSHSGAVHRSSLWSNRNINTAALLVAFLITLFLVVFFVFQHP